MLRQLTISALTSLFFVSTANGATYSYIPKIGVEHFIINNLDLSTFPSSLRPRLGPYHHFSDLRIRTSSITPNEIRLTDFWSGWIYSFKILDRGDFNGDGIEDLVVCFTDNGHPTGGSYYAIEPLLLTRLSANGPLIATTYQPVDTRCEKHPE